VSIVILALQLHLAWVYRQAFAPLLAAGTVVTVRQRGSSAAPGRHRVLRRLGAM
jgi:hypothetical protein